MITDMEIKILAGCNDCGRRISDGQRTTPGTVLAPPDEDRESSNRVPLCEECHGKWLSRQLFPNGFAV